MHIAHKALSSTKNKAELGGSQLRISRHTITSGLKWWKQNPFWLSYMTAGLTSWTPNQNMSSELLEKPNIFLSCWVRSGDPMHLPVKRPLHLTPLTVLPQVSRILWNPTKRNVQGECAHHFDTCSSFIYKMTNLKVCMAGIQGSVQITTVINFSDSFFQFMKPLYVLHAGSIVWWFHQGLSQI